MICPNPEHQY